jgi:hypothetical protein
MCKPNQQGIPQYGIRNGACVQDGVSKKPGEIWIKDNFKVTCTSDGRRSTLACISSDGKEVPVGQRKEVSPGRIGQCRRNGPLVFYDESYQGSSSRRQPGFGSLGRVVAETAVTVKPATRAALSSGCKNELGVQQPVGSTWVSGKFLYECEGTGTKKVVGCIGKNKFKIPINQGAIFGTEDYSCILRNGIVKYVKKEAPAGLVPHRTECDRNGKKYKIGAIWTESLSPFKYTCKNNGFVDIVACILPNKLEVPVNKSIQSGGLTHYCTRSGNRVTYRSEVIKSKG